MRFDALQASFFTPRVTSVVASEVTRRLLMDLSWFDGDPIVLPASAVLPEVPFVILRTARGDWQLRLSAARTDLVQTRVIGGGDLSIDSFVDKALAGGEVALAAVGDRPGRLGVVGNMFQEDARAAQTLSEAFFSPSLKPLGSTAKDAQLHLLFHVEIDEGVTVNSWHRWKVGDAQTAEGLKKVLVLERDVNTPAEGAAERSFDRDTVARLTRRLLESLRQEASEKF